jgi:alpha-tubulin suppressor-like RCC1 family protein
VPSNFKFTEGGTVKNFDDVFVVRDNVSGSDPAGGPGDFTVDGEDIQDYFVDNESEVDVKVGSTLLAWGNNSNGQLGINNTTNKLTPVPTYVGGSTWAQVSCGARHVGAIKTDGTLWTWGRNTYGQLGHNNTTQRNTPTKLGTATTWKRISCGGRTTTNAFTAAIKTDGTLWTWGRNSYGQLGHNDSTQRNTPTKLGTATNWRQVSCGGHHIAAIKTDGTLWIWGKNSYGQLGNRFRGSSHHRSTPVTTYAGGTNWKEVACGREFTLAVKTDGTLWVWGRNNTRQLGLGPGQTSDKSTPVQLGTSTMWRKVSGGVDHSSAIKTDGTLWLWGKGSNGELGNNQTSGATTKSSPVTTFAGGTNWKQVELGYRFSTAVKTDGTLWTWGTQSLGTGNLGINVSGGTRATPVTTFAGGTNWKQVSAGARSTVAVKSTQSSTPSIPVTNYKDSNGIDLGRKLVTQAYYTDIQS